MQAHSRTQAGPPIATTQFQAWLICSSGGSWLIWQGVALKTATKSYCGWFCQGSGFPHPCAFASAHSEVHKCTKLVRVSLHAVQSIPKSRDCRCTLMLRRSVSTLYAISATAACATASASAPASVCTRFQALSRSRRKGLPPAGRSRAEHVLMQTSNTAGTVVTNLPLVAAATAQHSALHCKNADGTPADSPLHAFVDLPRKHNCNG